MSNDSTVPKNVAPRPRPPGGSRKGIPNKITADLKQMILDALDQNGGVAYLADKAESHPAAFMALVAKVLPMQVTGAGGGAIESKITVEFVTKK